MPRAVEKRKERQAARRFLLLRVIVEKGETEGGTTIPLNALRLKKIIKKRELTLKKL